MDGEKNRIISQYQKISEYNKEKILKVSRVRVGRGGGGMVTYKDS